MKPAKNVLVLMSLMLGCVQPGSAQPPFEVLHWWTSKGEEAAAGVLRQRLTDHGLEWADYPVRGGGGESAMAVLKARVIAGEPPRAARIIGPNIEHWHALGFLQPLDHPLLVPEALFEPVIDQLIRVDDEVVAVPVSIHRINWMWLNPRVFEQLDLPLPTTWSQLIELAPTFRAAGIVPLAHGNQAWQNATLFETLLLSMAGPDFYQRYFIQLDEQSLFDDRVLDALVLLRELKALMDDQMHQREWQQASRMVADGEAAMQIMGDWVKGEFTAWGLEAGKDYLCLAVPGTNEQHLYSVDTFVLFHQESDPAQWRLFVESLIDEQTQRLFSQAKGTIPVRRNVPMDGFDDCARASDYVFRQASAEGRLAPSVAHSMATSPQAETAFHEIIHRFFMDERMTPETARSQLAQTLKALQ